MIGEDAELAGTANAENLDSLLPVIRLFRSVSCFCSPVARVSAKTPHPYGRHVVAILATSVLALILLLAFAPCGYACKCAPPQPGFKCPSLPDPTSTNTAIFVGSVTEVFPRSEEHMAELAREYGIPIPEDDSLDPEPLSHEEEQALVELVRRFILEQLESVLTQVQAEAIATAETADGKDLPLPIPLRRGCSLWESRVVWNARSYDSPGVKGHQFIGK